MLTTSLPLKKVRVSYETASGDFKNRYVQVRPEPGETQQTTIDKARDEYRRLYGFRSRIVAIDPSTAS